MNGLLSHLAELQQLIAQLQPYYVCIQESRLLTHQTINLRSYTAFRKDRAAANIASGGVTILCENSIFARKINLITDLEAVAISTIVPNYKKITICNIYLPPNENFTNEQIENIIDQLPRPYMIVGDFNSHNTIWGSTRTDTRGRKIETILNDNRVLLNDGTPTHFCANTGNFSNIDLSICDASLTPDLEWEVLSLLWGSHHFPIKITFPQSQDTMSNNNHRWNWKNANWEKFKSLANMNTPLDENLGINSIVENFTNKIKQAAYEAIGYKRIAPQNRNAPWWNDSCKKAVKKLKRALNRYRRTNTQEDLITLKKSRAISRRTLVESKKSSWQQYVSSITPNTPTTEIWSKIRRIKNKKNTIFTTTLVKDNVITTSQKDIAEIFAETFEKNSSTDNYSPEFITYKNQKEETPLNITNQENDINKPFTIDEINTAINSLKDKKSPGPDNITPEIIKNLPENTIKYLLSIYNHIWTNNVFPEKWLEVRTFPILKPNKDKTNPDNYRPISASNYFSKIMQSMVNQRLNWFLETNNILTKNQAGFRKKHSTTDNILLLATEIEKAFKRKEDLIAISFDIQKAYDITWRRPILESLLEYGLNGNIIHYFNNFLQNRTFKVYLKGHESSQKTQTNGVPQGEIVSVSLFLIAINKIIDEIEAPVKACLYADDLIIYCSGKNLYNIRTKLQQAINSLTTWCNKTGFVFSPLKTKAIHFNRKHYNQMNPKLKLQNNTIEYVDDVKFLGITFDKKLRWKKHLENIKKECTQRLNIIKMLGHQKWGASKDILLRLYQTIIRSKIEYSCAAFKHVKRTYKKKLQTIENTAIRIATGAFRTSPIKSLHCEASQLPLKYRLSELTLCYLANVASVPSSPIHQITFQPDSNKPRIINSCPLQREISQEMLNLDIEFPPVLKQSFPKHPPWAINKPKFNLTLAQYNKSSTPTNTFRKTYLAEIQQYQQFTNIFTDGSIIDNKTGAGILFNKKEYKFHLPNTAGIFTAEAFSVLKAIELIKQEREDRNFLIHTDSLSVIQSLQQLYTKNQLISDIQQSVHEAISAGKKIIFIWIPSHIGIDGNERADHLAKQAVLEETTQIAMPTNDIKSHIKRCIRQHWKQNWQASNKQLREIKEDINKWPTNRNRKEQVVLTRLRIGHSLITHKYIFERVEPPQCDTCETTLTIRHILKDCPKYEAERQKHKIEGTLKDILTNKHEHENRLIDFLRDINLFNQI